MSSIIPLTVPLVNLKKYCGVWYEIARLPMIWEDGCDKATAEYIFNEENGQIKVKNTCFCGGRELFCMEGMAYLSKEHFHEPAKLIMVFPNQKSEYWIHWTDYECFSIVGSPCGKNLWILGRKEEITKYELQNLVVFISQLGYDVSKLHFTNEGFL